MENITKTLDDNHPVDLVYLDFSKAFDKVPYRRLFKKLEAHGVGSQILGWIQDWLSNRRQRVGINDKFSDWQRVTSGVPQGSVLGPVLFLIYINDLDQDLVSKISKFADDTKLGKAVSTLEDCQSLQKDLDSLHNWSLEWQMEFNADKCSIIHLGHNNLQYNYSLGDKDLNNSICERDLGVLVDSNLKFSEHCNSVIKQANSTLGLIKRTIKNKDKYVISTLYKALVRPKLDYCVQAWHPYLKKNMKALEQVQHRATKMIKGFRNLSYKDRLDELDLLTLEDRYIRGDLIQVFKLIKGIDKLEYNKFFQLADNSKTRGHRYKIVKQRCRLELRRNFFSNRVIDSWNKLPADVVDAVSLNSFKNKLDKVWKCLFVD